MQKLILFSEESSSISFKNVRNNYTFLTLKGKLLNYNNCIFTDRFIKYLSIKLIVKYNFTRFERNKNPLKVAELSLYCRA